MTLTYWHNPRCSKSREGLAFLREKGIHPEVREYMTDVPTKGELEAVVDKLRLDSPRGMMRTKEAAYKAQGLADVTAAGALIEAMIEEPRLIERPILVSETKAAIGRPTEKLLDAIPSGRS
ncbi:arsenate reductase (glutaredoxin) [Marinicauda algicola]|uniref:Arsenate reductase n=1 Tax=Marinicauda algicola TaxID=2029849 RepID=A0A4S2H131_9PROT|nr:arsenate reductase (glutaredoxin) [Marinicauda algicola]TGY89240.1 arsenate reductase (glutaredoxin) [Marinicauda algicola]